MTAHGTHHGHAVIWKPGVGWFYQEDDKPIGLKPCCECGSYEHDIVFGSPDNPRRFGVDACIAGIVKALNEAGIATDASCCGHGKMRGIISLRDGRQLIIAPNYDDAGPLVKRAQRGGD